MQQDNCYLLFIEMAAQAVAAPLYECSIQGAFGDDLIAQVLERLRGLCSNETPLHYRELAYKSILGTQNK